jgi:hypothetical protein
MDVLEVMVRSSIDLGVRSPFNEASRDVGEVFADWIG